MDTKQPWGRPSIDHEPEELGHELGAAGLLAVLAATLVALAVAETARRRGHRTL